MLDTMQVAATGTGARHAITLEGRDVTGAALCGAYAFPQGAELEAVELAVVLNDLHLKGAKVCKVCRAAVNVRALRVLA